MFKTMRKINDILYAIIIFSYQFYLPKP